MQKYCRYIGALDGKYFNDNACLKGCIRNG